MRISDILRTMADVVDQAEGEEQAVQQPMQEPAVAQEPIAQEPAVAQEPTVQEPVETPCDAVDIDDTDLGPMVSPLQQEHELLKKSQGVDNNVSEFADDAGEGGYDSELASMKQMAGIGEEQARAKAKAEQTEMENQLNPRRNAAIAMQKIRSDRA